ncbi:PAS domain S-box protein [bacterium]|nr:PAS domain S-box protein [bacterium]
MENFIMANEINRKNRNLRQEVKRSEYRYRDLLENVNDFIFRLDDKGRFSDLNNRFHSLTGWEKDKWLGEKFLSLIDPADRPSASEHYQMAYQGRARIFEAKILGNSNRSSMLSFNISPIIERGKIVGSIGIARDVTEQKKMEREILDLKNFNESIIQSMEAGLLTTDLEGHITSLNAGGEKILGWKARSVIGKQIKSVLKPEEVAFLLSKSPLPGTLPYSRETELTIKTGKKIAIGFTTTNRINNQRKKVGTIISFRDISQLKQMQSEVIRMDRLASLGVLASGIAHEIKNPLAGIKTMAQACDEEFDENDPRREYLTRIVRQVNRLDDLLKTFFAYARPKPPNRKQHQLSEILREVITLVSKRLTNSGITYHENFHPDIPKLMIDSQQFQQVFLNLILNAVEAMPSGGTLTISANRIGKSEKGIIQRNNKSKNKFMNGSHVEIIVSDTGTGIDYDKLETIFDPFFTTKSNGTGLGLSIVYRIVEEHQGDIRVESRIGSGTSFKITLPTGD